MLTRAQLATYSVEDIIECLKHNYDQRRMFETAVESNVAYYEALKGTRQEPKDPETMQGIKNKIDEYKAELAIINEEIAAAEEELKSRGEQAPCPFVSGMR